MRHIINMLAPRQDCHGPPVALLEPQVLRLQPLMGQMLRYAAHIFRDGHSVVVENDQNGLAALASIGQPLIGQAAGQRAVAKQGSHMVILPFQRSRPGHTQGYRH